MCWFKGRHHLVPGRPEPAEVSVCRRASAFITTGSGTGGPATWPGRQSMSAGYGADDQTSCSSLTVN